MYSKTKKSIFLSFAFIIFFLSVNAQALLQFSAQEKPSFKQMQRDFAAWKDTTNLKERKNWKYIKRWEVDMQMHTDAQGEPTGFYDYTNLLIESAAQKETLAYMWNEEKLAKDIYLALNGIYPSQQLSNIATKAETQHESSVEALLKKYNLSVRDVLNSSGTATYSAAALATIPAGSYTLPELQSLYNALYAEGSISAQKSLEVGCKVEVTDVNDLNKDLVIATGAQDLVIIFENLRAGSYNHYWAFDKGLKNIGVTTGCCSLGNDFCHPEYPNNNESGQNSTTTTSQSTAQTGSGVNNGTGNQYGKN